MGQRHQMFVIAKVNGRYRTLAAVDHNWLYGSSAARQCRNLLRILSSELNHPGLRQDLQTAESFDFDNLSPYKEINTESSINVICPFITTCLAIGTSLDKNTAGCTRAEVLHLASDYYCLNNDDGISIYDVTEPENVRYGFLFLRDVESLAEAEEYDNEVKGTAPANEPKNEPPNLSYEALQIVTASQYISRYYTPREQQEYKTHLVTSECDRFQLVSVSALNSVRPDGGGRSGEDEAQKPDSSETPFQRRLREHMLTKVVGKILQSPSHDLSWSAQAQALPDFISAVRKALVIDPEFINTPAGTELLLKPLQGSTTIDLTPFRSLRVKQLLEFTNHLSTDSNTKAMYLPVMDDLDASNLKTVIQSAHIKTLYLGEHTRIDITAVLAMATDLSLVGIRSPALYRRVWDHACSSTGQNRNQELATVRHSGGGMLPLKQAVYIRQTRPPHSTSTYYPRLSGGGLEWSKIFAAPYSGWSETSSSPPITFVFPLCDATLSAGDLYTALPSAFRLMFAARPDQVGRSGAAAQGMGFAQVLALNDEHAVRPIPAQLYSPYARTYHMMAHPPVKVQSLTDGWTLIVVQEKTSENFFEDSPDDIQVRIAFVTADGTGGFRVEGIEGFINSALTQTLLEPGRKLDEYVNVCQDSFSRAAGVEVGVCGQDEVKELDAMFQLHSEDIERRWGKRILI